MKPWWFEEPDPSASPGEDILYEAVLPIVQEAQLNQATIDTYTSLMQNGLRPTALALSVVDVRVLSGRGLDWRLMHFLLDGHHKIMAADRSGKPITLLSFLNISESFAGREWVDLAIQARYQG